MKPSEALKAHRSELRRLVASYGVLRPRIFGSVLHGEDTEESDLDLLVDPTPSTTLLTLGGLQLDAEKLLGVRVDVLTPKALPRRAREQILQEAAPL
ncbi:MAG: nucleotidyltransferase family protein [Sinobacteraceae bacterium]|nr:nucleotidyltransferase family protein [Nevskia sp.]MDI3259302.1 nucleotidyltransferase family protein [Nevskiaceae bacterium]